MDEKERAELVAYLDGELDEEAAQRVETKVNIDPTVRAELESLRRTWEMLDYLPRAEPSPSFTNQTLSRLPQHAKKTQPQPVARSRSPWLPAVWLATALVAAVLGYTATARYLSEPTEQDLIRELRVIEHYQMYKAIPDLEFLKGLDEPDLFGDEDSDF